MATYTIKKYHGKYNRTRKSGSYKYIVVHYTSTNASALNNCKYFSGGNRNASAHYFIDSSSIYEYLDPHDYYAWSVGDGHGRYGITNANSINIEVCRDNRAFTDGEISRLAFLVQKLMKEFNIPASRVVRHYDASRKQCPAYYVNSSRWNALKKKITKASSSSTTTTVSGSKCTAYKVNATNGLNLRKGPGTKYAKVGSIADGDVVLIQSISNGWAKTKNGRYCSAQYLKKCTTSTPYVVTAANGLIFREGPGSGYSRTRTVAQNLRVFFYGSQGDWMVSTSGDYASKKYLAKLTRKVVDSENGLNCRKGPGTGYAKTRFLKDCEVVYIRSNTGGWAKTQEADYCSSTYLKSRTKYKVTASNGLIFRKGRGADYDKTRTLKKGSEVYIISIKNDWGKTEDGDFCNMEYLEKA